ncbi:hypothetical protein ACFL0M_02960 [Thermodesulfobacteriota bacterium]
MVESDIMAFLQDQNLEFRTLMKDKGFIYIKSNAEERKILKSVPFG